MMNTQQPQQTPHLQSAYPSITDPLPGDEQPVAQATTTTEPPRQRFMSVKLNNVTEAYNETESTLISNIPIANHPRAKLMFRLAMTLTIFNMLCVVIWLLTSPRSYFWPIHTIYCSLILQLFLFIFSGTFERPTKVYSAHSSFAILSLMKLILMNLMAGYYPWAIFPASVLSIVWLIHTLHVVVPVYFNTMTIHGIVYVIINFMLFVVYCYERHLGFPWFLIILVFWGVLLAVHVIVYKSYMKKKAAREQAVAQQGETVITNIPQQPQQQQPHEQPFTGFASPPQQQQQFVQQQMAPQQQQFGMYPHMAHQQSPHAQHFVQQPQLQNPYQQQNFYAQNSV